MNNVLKEFDDIKKEIKSKSKYKIKVYTKQFYLIAWSVEKIQKVRIQNL